MKKYKILTIEKIRAGDEQRFHEERWEPVGRNNISIGIVANQYQEYQFRRVIRKKKDD
jgi:hypothetical protein